uniref:AC_N domain-containing protein n=1 Tax=Ascaris lumbricoides TaxID=6252 RepID=A0A0M3IN23_ASCLU
MRNDKTTIAIMDFSPEKIFKYKLCGWFALLVNFAMLLTTLLISRELAIVAINYSFITLTYLTALICAAFALKDNSAVMLYPILVSLVNCGEEANLPLIYNLILLGIVLGKLFEFVLFRRIMKIFERQRCNEHFEATQVKNAFNTNCDTDDEIVVFEKISQSGLSTIYDYGRQRSSA